MKTQRTTCKLQWTFIRKSIEIMKITWNQRKPIKCIFVLQVFFRRGAPALPNEFILYEYYVKTTKKYTETDGKRFSAGRSRLETHGINPNQSISININKKPIIIHQTQSKSINKSIKINPNQSKSTQSNQKSIETNQKSIKTNQNQQPIDQNQSKSIKNQSTSIKNQSKSIEKY